MARKKRHTKRPANRIARAILKVLNGQVLTEKGTARLIPYVLFLTLLGVCYIANIHFAEKTVREIDKISSELKELKSEYITTKSELMYNSKQSEVAKAVQPLGLKESLEPPKKILVSKEDNR